MNGTTPVAAPERPVDYRRSALSTALTCAFEAPNPDGMPAWPVPECGAPVSMLVTLCVRDVLTQRVLCCDQHAKIATGLPADYFGVFWANHPDAVLTATASAPGAVA